MSATHRSWLQNYLKRWEGGDKDAVPSFIGLPLGLIRKQLLPNVLDGDNLNV